MASFGKGIIFLGFLFLFFRLHLFPLYQTEINNIAGEKIQSLDALFSYTKDDVFQLFETVKIEGRQKMKFISGVIDMIYPLIYGLLFFLLLTKFTNNFSNKTLKAMRFFPLIGMLFDYIENFNVLNMLNAYPIIPESQVVVSSSATSLKWLFLIISMLLILSLVGVKIFQKIKATY